MPVGLDVMTIIDAHQHYWQLQRFDYAWQKQINRPEMNRDYLPLDLLPAMRRLGLQYSVVIQADNSLAETNWMLELAHYYPHIAGVVGWVDLAAPDVAEILDQWAKEPLFKGIRLMPLPEEDWRSLHNGLQALSQRGLTCDLLPDQATLPMVIEMIRSHPETRFVVNHFAGLSLTPGGVGHWSASQKLLAALPNVFMKCSAIQALAQPPPISRQILWPYIESALALFGSERLLFGSDWPVSTLSGSYDEGVRVMREVTASLSRDEQSSIWGGTAITAYQLTLRP